MVYAKYLSVLWANQLWTNVSYFLMRDVSDWGENSQLTQKYIE